MLTSEEEPQGGGYTSELPGGLQKIPLQTLPCIIARLSRGLASRSTTLGKAGRGAGCWPCILSLPTVGGTSEALQVTWIDFQTLLRISEVCKLDCHLGMKPTHTHMHTPLLTAITHTHVLTHSHLHSEHIHSHIYTHIISLAHMHYLPPSLTEI